MKFDLFQWDSLKSAAGWFFLFVCFFQTLISKIYLIYWLIFNRFFRFGNFEMIYFSFQHKTIFTSVLVVKKSVPSGSDFSSQLLSGFFFFFTFSSEKDEVAIHSWEKFPLHMDLLTHRGKYCQFRANPSHYKTVLIAQWSSSNSGTLQKGSFYRAATSWEIELRVPHQVFFNDNQSL